jgi:hypothetical protein
MLSSYHIDTDCLLEASQETICAVSLLPVISATQSPAPAIADGLCYNLEQYPSLLSFMAFALPSMTVIVQLQPEVKILYKWQNSTPIQSSPEASQLLDWTWFDLPNTTYVPLGNDDVSLLCHANTPVLTRCMGNSIEMISMHVKGYPKTTSRTRRTLLLSTFGTSFGATEDNVVLSYEFNIEYHVTLPVLDTIVYALKWMNASQLLLFTTQEMMLLDQRLVILERVSLLPAIRASITWQQSSSTSDIGSIASQSMPEVCLYDNRVIVCTSEDMYVMTTRSPFDSVDALITQGKYIEALGLIIEHIHKSPALLFIEAETIQKYILNYVLLAVTPAPTHHHNQHHPGSGTSICGGVVSSASYISLSGASSSYNNSHLYLVASVCIEYCVVTKNTSLLFQEIYRLFASYHLDSILLNAFEPFIYHKQISSMPAHIVQAFLQNSLKQQQYNSIERCVFYFDLNTLDLDFLTRFLYTNQMVSAFLYLYSQCVGDASRAVGYIFLPIYQVLYTPGVFVFAERGYKLLLFVLYTAEDKIYPRGLSKVIGYQSLLDLINYLLQVDYLTIPSLISSTSIVSSKEECVEGLVTNPFCTLPHSRRNYPYLSYFTLLDASALLHVLCTAWSKLYTLSMQSKVSDDFAGIAGQLDIMLKFTVYIDTIITSFSMHKLYLDKCSELLPNMAHVVMTMELWSSLVSHCSNKARSSHHRQEALLTTLVESQCKLLASHNSTTWSDISNLLCLKQYYIAALSIRHVEEIEVNYKAALTFYLSLVDTNNSSDSNNTLVFDYITLQYANFERRSDEAVFRQKSSFSQEVVTKLLDLAAISLDRTVLLLSEQLLTSITAVIEAGKYNSKLQFAVLTALITQQTAEESLSTLFGQYFNSVNMIDYLYLHTVYSLDTLLVFVQKHMAYIPLDECMQIMKEHNVADVLSYLYEKCGDVQTALQVCYALFWYPK